MWTVLEHKQLEKQLRKTPRQVQVNYLNWRHIMELQGPEGLHHIKGFHDEALKGEWFGFRSSRLNLKWRVIYKLEKKACVVYVLEVNAHAY